MGGVLSKPYAWEQIYARGQKLVLSSSFSSNKERHRFSFSAVLDTWHMDINTRSGAMAEYMHDARGRVAPECVMHIFSP